MSCCNEQTASLSTKNPDPTKHVNYAKGMVLGVDDFTQEFVYLAGRDEWLARDLVGYGTTSGLALTTEDDGKNGPRVRVKTGSAVSPRGTLICVSGDQCASLNAWLAKSENAKKIPAIVTSPPSDTISLFVTLCYANCLTDRVPIPGEPCRAEDDLMAASRVADDFSLSIDTVPPQQREERALRDFVQWLRGIECDDITSPPSVSEKELLEALREAAAPWLAQTVTSPPIVTSPPPSDFMFGSPPAWLRIHPDQRCDLLRVAFRFWVTEVRPLWMARCCACAGNVQPADDCLLLAELRVPIVGNPGTNGGTVWQVNGTHDDIEIKQDSRPYLIHQRLLQEWLLCERQCGGAGNTSEAMAAPTTIHGTPSEAMAAPKTIHGTSNQISVAESFAAFTLSTPQDIASASRPQFGGLTTTGRVQIQVDVIGASTTLTDKMHCIICTAANITLTLPSAAFSPGRVYIVKNSVALSATSSLKAVSTDTIENGATFAIKKGQSATLISDGTSTWHVIATS